MMHHNIQYNRTRKLNVKFVVTSLPVGGAETLLVNLMRQMDKSAFAPEVVCLKKPGELGETIAQQVPLYSSLLHSKWDIGVLSRLTRLFHQSPTDAVVTVGAGDKMFWGRLAARLARVPVICSALHSTGWPDEIGRMNRFLTDFTDGFIACAAPHAEYLATHEKLPRSKVFMIPNGVDTDRFRPNHTLRIWLRDELGISHQAQVVGIVAALRPEKNHSQFVLAAREILREHANTHFVIVGEGPERGAIQQLVHENGLNAHVHLLGNRSDTQQILAGLDVFCLTSRNEANPVSILEALACCIPVVAPDVGSIGQTVIPSKTGLLTTPHSWEATADAIAGLLGHAQLAKNMGLEGRKLVRENWSLEAMVTGYESLLETLYNAKALKNQRPAWIRPETILVKRQEPLESETRLEAPWAPPVPMPMPMPVLGQPLSHGR